VTLLNVRNRARSALEEATARFWSDGELTAWVNDALRDIARRAEVIQSFNTTITTVAGTAKYTLPTNVIRVHRVEFAPTGQSQIYPLEPSNHNYMDSMWGVNQSSPGTPRFYVMFGFPPTLQIQVYPVPNQTGVLNLYYYRLPATVSSDADVLEIPEGWDDAVVDYVEAQAKRKDHDQSWVEAYGLYEAKVQQMIDRTRHWHDQANAIQVGRSYVPSWLYAFDD
jgi:hypothetical protein